MQRVKNTERNSKSALNNTDNKLEKAFFENSYFHQIPNGLSEQKQLLSNLWKAYSNHMDRFGETPQTRYLRDRYFQVLRIYRKNKEWQSLLKSG